MADEEKQDGINNEIQKKMDFIVEQQAQFAANIQAHDERLARLENIVTRLAEATVSSVGTLTESHMRLVEAQKSTEEAQRRTEEARKKTEEAFARLAESQAHTDKRLDALIDIIRQDREGRNGKS